MTTCRHCRAPLPSGFRLCPVCGRMQEAVSGTVDSWREDHFACLDRLRAEGATHVRWVCTDDPALCAHCAGRDGRVYTLQEAREAIQGRFCDMDPFQGRCRCVFENATALV